PASQHPCTTRRSSDLRSHPVQFQPHKIPAVIASCWLLPSRPSKHLGNLGVRRHRDGLGNSYHSCSPLRSRGEAKPANLLVTIRRSEEHTSELQSRDNL